MSQMGALFTLLMTVPHAHDFANAGTVEPRRTDIDVRADASLVDLQRCISRQMAKSGGQVTPVPIEGGVALDYTVTVLVATGGESKFSVEIVDLGDQRRLTATYRRPMTAKSAAKEFRIHTRPCLPDGTVEGI